MKGPSTHMLLLLLAICHECQGREYDFEEPNTEEDNFQTGQNDGSSKEISSDYAKSGDQTLKWRWPVLTTESKTYTLNWEVDKDIDEKTKKSGGLKLWMYRPQGLASATMTIKLVLQNNRGGRPKIANVNLKWKKGWRGVWISYGEFEIKKSQTSHIREIIFTVTQPSGSEGDNMLYFDLVQLTTKVQKQTRDAVVPFLGAKQDDARNSYQRTYYWSQKDVPSPDDYLDSDISIEDYMRDIREIKRRVDNWYADLGTSTYDTLDNSDLNAFRKKKLKSLYFGVNKAHQLYEQLTSGLDTNDDIKKPPLFTKVSEYGKDTIDGDKVKTKFSYITEKILQPIGIDYILMSRAHQIDSTLQNDCSVLQSGTDDEKEKAKQRIAGTSDKMVALIPDIKTCDDLADAIDALNEERKNRIISIFKYLYDQGFADGSGLGSLDHEWNKNGAGFMHALYAVRNNLDAELRDQLIKAAKWFNDFNEVYSDTYEGGFEFDGTTSDQMKTMMFYRFLTVLVMPEGNLDQKKKIRDMLACKANADNSMKVNLGLGGVFKPDGTSYHHQAFYAPAYAPHAIHTASVVYYILQSTLFKLEIISVVNLKRSLEVMRIVAVKYSTPNSLSGRFPNYAKRILARILPAYAYISCDLKGDTVRGSKMFHRLFDPNNEALKEELENGGATNSAYYLNTLGSLDVTQWVLTKSATAEECQNVPQCKEDSQHGHWSYNFAALAIQRRENWAVAARGFSHFVWDYESGGKENFYGIFGSYGSLQISNSEESLASYDVNEGWDWSRVQGATTINLKFKDMVLEEMRYYNPESLAGGGSICGTDGTTAGAQICKTKNGVFAMQYSKPAYKPKEDDSPLENIEFSFKKSFFFMENMIVCVVTDVDLQNAPAQYYAQTTLFQDKQLDSNTHIEIDGAEYNLGDDMEQNNGFPKQNILLKDANGNTYRVPDVADSGLHVKISEQTSVKHKGCGETKGRYATAWLKHDSQQQYARYDVLIEGGSLERNNFRDAKLRKKDNTAHIVEFEDLPKAGLTTFGYSIFEANTPFRKRRNGPVFQANHECVIVTEEGGDALFIAVTNPGYQLVRDGSKDETIPCKEAEDEDFDIPMEQSKITKELLYCSKSDSITISVTLRDSYTPRINQIEKVWVNKKEMVEDDKGSYASLEDDNGHKVVVFERLENGFTSEVKISLN